MHRTSEIVPCKLIVEKDHIGQKLSSQGKCEHNPQVEEHGPGEKIIFIRKHILLN